MEIRAAVVNAAGSDFNLETVELQEPHADEVVVEIAGVGICRTDIGVKDGHLPFAFPAVLGHEGSGTVVSAGRDVKSISVGDKVVISFDSCATCRHCRMGEPASCHEFMLYNFSGTRIDGTSSLTRLGEPLASNFFGQSSMATHSVARERNVVRLPAGAPVEIAGPLGCGIQTGAGAVFTSFDVQPGSSVAVLGGGSVGLAAVMAAVVREASPIIVVEPHQSRRELALELGATHVVDPGAGSIGEQIRRIATMGVDYGFDTAAVLPATEELLMAMGVRGAVGLIGMPANPAEALPLNILHAQVLGLTVRGIVEGDADPQTFIPYLLDLYRQGKFPFDRLITTMPISRINDAVAAQRRCEAIKIVLTTAVSDHVGPTPTIHPGETRPPLAHRI